MDINSLLSPQDSPASETPPPNPQALHSPSLQSPSKQRTARQAPSRTPSGLHQHITSSPQQFHRETPPHHRVPGVAAGAASFHHHMAPSLSSPGLAGFTNGREHSASSTPPVDARPQLASPHGARMTPPNALYRQASTPGMDTLADLASMQQAQHTNRQHSATQRPSISIQNITRTISGGSASDIVMAEPSPRPPRNFTSTVLDAATNERLNALEKALAENPFNYQAHVMFITILHDSLQTLLHPSNDPVNEAQRYELMPILRDAYMALDTKYPLPEHLWEHWLNDEMALARDISERMELGAMFSRATEAEPFSTKLWAMYGDWLAQMSACVWDEEPLEGWSKDDKEIGQAYFTTEMLLEVSKLGADKVKYNINDSNLVWDRYLQLLDDDLERQYAPEKVRTVANIYDTRLGQPHATWDNTFQRFSVFTSKYNSSTYEAIMQRTTKQSRHIKQQYSLREDREFKVLQAVQAGDPGGEHHAFMNYLTWEKRSVGVYTTHLVVALYRRATLRFPVDPALWQNYIDFLVWQGNDLAELLGVIERANRHCPWSGELWAYRILTLENLNRKHAEIQDVKHSATNSGVFQHSDLEEHIIVQNAWCGYLRRTAFDSSTTSDDIIDTAQMGILSALEDVRNAGKKMYGNDWPGDPKYRLQRRYIEYLTVRGSLKEARDEWNDLIPFQSKSYDFWGRYYAWEMRVRGNNPTGGQLPTPSLATAVLDLALKHYPNMDEPEKLLELYCDHCEQHESIVKIRTMMNQRRTIGFKIAMRRDYQAKAIQKASYAQESAHHAQESAHPTEGSGKRKRGDTPKADDSAAKKSNQQDDSQFSLVVSSVEAQKEAANVKTAGPKRDREHASIIVKQLPAGATQTQVRQLFSQAGTVVDIVMKEEKDGLTATVEFESIEVAEYAVGNPIKEFDGHSISISSAANTTIYVSNYPAEADEADLRKLFGPYGNILQIRLPSLRAKITRRFCYIQYSKPSEAINATKLNRIEMKGHQLQVKISDPEAAQRREGALFEGRELYVWNLNFGIQEKDLKEAFSKFGDIIRLKVPKHAGGSVSNNKGFAYIEYKDRESIDAAISGMHGQPLWGRKLEVQRSEPKAKVTSQLVNDAPSPENTDITPSSAQSRSFALLGLPDTIKDARIEALVKPYGYKKITLMPTHQGAIVEFMDIASMAKATLGLEGKEIAEGKKIRIGTIEELRATKPAWKPRSSFMQPTRVNRPVAKRGRGGIGLPIVSARRVQHGKAIEGNQKFRSMVLGEDTKADSKVDSKAASKDDEMQDTT